MRLPITLTLLTTLILSATRGQISVDVLPYSMLAGIDRSSVPDLPVSSLDAKAVADEDVQRAVDGKIPYYSRLVPVNADLYSSGLWRSLPNGDRLWRLRVVATGAMATELYFDQFQLPEGATLHVYDDDGAQILGAFTSYNNHESGLFTTALVSGPVSTLEYYEPVAVAGEGSLRITHLGHAYRMVSGAKADDCEVNVRCSPEGDDWTLQKNGVVRLSVVDPGGAGWCSGSVVDNTAHDLKPYILSAFHCGVNSTAANFLVWKAYFLYERTGCTTGSASASKVMTGCVKRADSNDGGGNSGSDFLLVEMNNPIPGNYFPYWNGWNASGTGSTGGVGIHHPAGSEKKISTFTVTTQSSAWGATNTHWRVTWASTTNGWGVTEGGSSGSPLFNNAGLIIGTLTGGASYCNSVVPGANDDPDYYGKLSYHWDMNPGPASEYLGVWLDPVGGGSTTTTGGSLGMVENNLTPGPELYPNPALDMFSVIYPDDVTTVDRIDVLDVSGRVVRSIVPMTRARADIATDGWAAGTYFVALVADGVSHAGTQLTIVDR